MGEVALTKQQAKSLFSDTRMLVLKALHERRMTVSELSTKLLLNKATVHAHLNELVESNFIKRIEDDRKWVYYDLTDNGKNVVSPKDSIKFILLLSVGILGLIAVFFLIFQMGLFSVLPFVDPNMGQINDNTEVSFSTTGTIINLPEYDGKITLKSLKEAEIDLADGDKFEVGLKGGTINFGVQEVNQASLQPAYGQQNSFWTLTVIAVHPLIGTQECTIRNIEIGQESQIIDFNDNAHCGTSVPLKVTVQMSQNHALKIKGIDLDGIKTSLADSGFSVNAV